MRCCWGGSLAVLSVLATACGDVLPSGDDLGQETARDTGTEMSTERENDSGTTGPLDERDLMACDSSYFICDVSAGCILDDSHFSEGAFPGTYRYVIQNKQVANVRLILRLVNTNTPGTETIIQVRRPDCTLDSESDVLHILNQSLVDAAGEDNTLQFDVALQTRGEHLVEVYSDAGAEFHFGYLIR